MEISNAKSSESSTSDTSFTLRERRKRQLEQERLLRSRMNRIGSPDSAGGFSNTSSGSFEGSVETSLISLNQSRSSLKESEIKKSMKWEKVPVEFAFGLLTSKSDAPRKGMYHGKRSTRPSDDTVSTKSSKSSSKLLDNSPILKFIMTKAGELSKAAVQNRSGNVIIKARSPYVESVVRDRAYQPPPDRPFVVRSYIKAVVPIEISDLSGSLTRSTQIISKIVIKEALIEGAKRKIFEPLVEDEF